MRLYNTAVFKTTQSPEEVSVTYVRTQFFMLQLDFRFNFQFYVEAQKVWIGFGKKYHTLS